MTPRDEALRRWDALGLTLPSADADEICGLLAPITLGVECCPADGDRTRVRVYLRPGGVAGAPAFAADVIERYGIDPATCDARIETVEDGRWVERYQAQLVPFDLGRGFTVLPSGRGQAPPGRRGLLLVPGRAFGTGEHPTTQLCAAELERRVRPGSLWLDVGCGTAILSMVARYCGAARVLAVDDDPDAVEVAGEVLAGNGLAEGIEVRLGRLEDLGAEAFDGIVVNISAPFFDAAAPGLAGRLRPDGLLIASGFIGETAAGVESALAAAGLRLLERESREPWVVLVASRA